MVKAQLKLVLVIVAAYLLKTVWKIEAKFKKLQWKINLQYLLNIVLTVTVAYLLNIVWNQPAKESDLAAGQGHNTKVKDSEPNPDWKQDHVVTSVWCHQGNNKLCQFENLCYSSDKEEFLMFRDEASIVENVKVIDGALTLDLSSVKDHNAMQTSISSVPSKYSPKFNIIWVEKRTLVFKRFLPDNLMHMFHDDILPLHDTLKYLTYRSDGSRSNGSDRRSRSDPYSVQLVVLNDTEEELDEEVEMFYQMFSKFNVKFTKDLSVLNGLTCFEDVTLGLSTRTIWYDYGFKSPQGPLSEITLTSDHVLSTVNFVMQNLEALLDMRKESDFVVLLTRKESRRILNEINLTLAIARATSLRVVNLSLDTHTLVDIISYIRHCRGIIGMHGSLLMLSMFMSPNSFLVEMFPYAVNADNYTPYKTFCQSSDMNLVYTAWTNQKKESSVGHPDWSPDTGGINHLEEQQREIILSHTEVPPHVCCSDPSWLYHIYQDTVVDVPEVASLVKSSLDKLDLVQSDTNQHQNPWDVFRPSKVKGVRCHISYSDSEFNLNINLIPPWTVSFIQKEYKDITYEILIQNIAPEHPSVFSHKTRSEISTIVVDQDGMYVVWVRGMADNNNFGPFSESVFCIK